MPRKPTRTPAEQFELDQFAKRLQGLRTAKGYSQSDLAREVWGEIVSKRTGHKVAKNRDRISSYEMGKSWPEPQTLAKIAAALGVTPEELAPGRTGAPVERQNPEFAAVTVANHPDKVMLRFSMLVSFDEMARIVALLNELKLKPAP